MTSERPQWRPPHGYREGVRTHRVADVAEQSGLSPATVDRVLHGRPGASPRAVRAVEQAVAELDRQERSLRLGARSLVVDVVMQAPSRFSDAVREAVESQLGAVGPTAVRARFDVRESGEAEDLVAALDRVGRRGRTSHGVVLKAPGDPEVVAAVDALAARGIPTVTLVTDVPSRRVAYVGLDNRAAGRTAAHLVARGTRRTKGVVLASVSRSAFTGEGERLHAFVEGLREDAPRLRVVTLAGADGLDVPTREMVDRALGSLRLPVRAVYSAGGGNRAILGALAAAGEHPDTFVAHDLDEDNLELLRTGAVDLVLHHDLRADARAALRQLLRHHDLAPGAPTSVAAGVQVVTRHNVPARLGPR